MSSVTVRTVTVVVVQGRSYRSARPAAENWAGLSAFNRHGFCRQHNRKDVDFNDWHRRAFRRSLPVFERILGPSKNRSNPRTLIDIVIDPNSSLPVIVHTDNT